MTLGEAFFVGDTEQVPLRKGVGWSGIETTVLLDRVSFRATHSYTDPKESRGVQASGGRGSGDSSNTGELLGNPCLCREMLILCAVPAAPRTIWV